MQLKHFIIAFFAAVALTAFVFTAKWLIKIEQKHKMEMEAVRKKREAAEESLRQTMKRTDSIINEIEKHLK